jgi:hypothetical protein
MDNNQIIEKIDKKIEERERIFNYLFQTPEGQIVYKDLRTALVINPEFLTKDLTNDIEKEALIQYGMKIAFQYIDNNLNLQTIKNL